MYDLQMIPVKLYTTEDSFLIFSITIPIWVGVRMGFKPDRIIRDKPFAPKLTLATGQDKLCLHAYCLNWRLRIRSDSCMKRLGFPAQKVIASFDKGWIQFFESAIL